MNIALISDIHGNYPALEAVMESEDFKAADQVYCLGDLVGYYPYPEECVARVRRQRIPCVMGNHDYSCVENRPCRNNRIGRASLELTRRLVSRQTIVFLSEVPDRLEVQLNKERLYLVHGSPENPLNGYVLPGDSVNVPIGCGILAMGHTHKQFSRNQSGRLLLNPGSVGQPRDGKGACFAVLDLEGFRAGLHRVNYDPSEVIQKTEQLGCHEAAEKLRRSFELNGLRR